MQKGIIVFFLAVLMTSTTSYADHRKILNTQNGHTYKLFQNLKTWTEAKSHCESLGGYLVTITSKEEQNFLFDYILRFSKKGIWAGATDKDEEGNWKWITGEEFDYTNWKKREPNNENGIENYLELRVSAGFRWNDVPNDVTRNWFICEWDSQQASDATISPDGENEKNRELSGSATVEESEDLENSENINDQKTVSTAQSFTYYLPLFTYSDNYLTGVGISNSSVSQEANLLIDIFNNQGQVILEETLIIPPDGQKTKVLYTENNRHGWTRIVSDQPLTGVGFIIAAGTGTDNFMADISLSPTTYTDLHIPHVSSDKSWDTHLFIANPNDFQVTVYIDVIGPDGKLTESSSQKIAAMGSTDFSLSSVLKGENLVGGKVKMFGSGGFVAYALYTNIKTGARSFAGINPMEPFSRTGNLKEAD